MIARVTVRTWLERWDPPSSVWRSIPSCIRCGRCIQCCPMGLMPLMYVNLVKKGMTPDLADYHVMNCVECGACTYDCPAGIPIVSYIKVGKAKLRQLGGN